MTNVKMFLIQKCIDLCNFALRFSDGARDQDDINELVSLKNELINKRDKMAAGL